MSSHPTASATCARFTHPEAGAFLRELWAAGESRENEDVARLLGYEPFDTTYLAEQFLLLEEENP